MNIEDVRDFCQDHVNGLSQQGRDSIFDILRTYVPDDDIDSSNSDGSRVYMNDIPDEAFYKIHDAIKVYLEP